MKNEKKAAPAAEQTRLTAYGAIKYIICYSSVVFNAISLILLIPQALSTDSNGVAFVDPARFLAIYPVALCTTAASLIFRANMKTVFKVLIHYAVTITAFYVFICAPIKSTSKPLAIVAVTSLLYFIGVAIDLGIRAAIDKKKRVETPYQSVYGKLTKK